MSRWLGVVDSVPHDGVVWMDSSIALRRGCPPRDLELDRAHRAATCGGRLFSTWARADVARARTAALVAALARNLRRRWHNRRACTEGLQASSTVQRNGTVARTLVSRLRLYVRAAPPRREQPNIPVCESFS